MKPTAKAAIAILVGLGLYAPLMATAMTPRELLDDGHVRIRVTTEPAHRVFIGQQTRLFVEILTDTWFTRAPSYPELSLDGAIALLPEQFGSNFTERIDGVTFAAQRRSYVIFPERAGRLKIPSIRIRLGVSQDGRAGTPFTVQTRPFHLNVMLPAEAEAISAFVTTPRLRVHDDWSRPLEDLKVGDALERTVRVNAERALGMLLPDLIFDAPSGIAVYPDQPAISDEINRGQYRGQREEHVTYILQQPGSFTLPSIELYWLDPSSGTLMTEILASRTIDVAAVAGAVARQTPLGSAGSAESWRTLFNRGLTYLREHRLAIAVFLVIGIAMFFAIRSGGPALLSSTHAWRTKNSDSERRRFRELQRSIKREKIAVVARDFWHWRDRMDWGGTRLADERWHRAAAESGFERRWAEFEKLRYASDSPERKFDFGDLRRTLRILRRSLLSAKKRPPSPSDSMRLNPGGRLES